VVFFFHHSVLFLMFCISIRLVQFVAAAAAAASSSSSSSSSS
jgi:hypothetical protein